VLEPAKAFVTRLFAYVLRPVWMLLGIPANLRRLWRRAESYPPTFVASLLMLFLTAVRNWVGTRLSLTSSTLVDVIVGTTILASMLYFYTYEFYTDRNEALLSRLRQIGRREWYLRLFSHLILLGMSFSLEFGVSYFFVALLAFYVCILCWDGVVFGWQGVKDAARNRVDSPTNIVACDIAGLVNTVIFILAASATILSQGGSVFGIQRVMFSADTSLLDSPFWDFALGICVTVYLVILAASLKASQGSKANSDGVKKI
jgi:hypothetical protein